MSRYDILVLGGGIIGCSIAEELTRYGQKVAVIERGTAGTEASAAAAGMLHALVDCKHPDALFDLCRASRRIYPRWVENVQRRSGIQVDYTVDGVLYLAFRGREEVRMDRQMRWQSKRGIRIERISRRDVAKREPAIDGAVRRGYLFPSEAQVDTSKLMKALIKACKSGGVDFFEQSPVKKIAVKDNKIAGVECTGREFHAPVVVNAMGCWSSMRGRFPAPLEVGPVRGQMLAVAASKRLYRHAVVSDRAYFVQRKDGRVIVGSTLEPGNEDKQVTPEGIFDILAGVRAMSSSLMRYPILETWAGLRPAAPDGMPILGPTRVEGLLVATAHYRQGILLAPATARVMADLILKGRTTADLTPFTPLRFERPAKGK